MNCRPTQFCHSPASCRWSKRGFNYDVTAAMWQQPIYTYLLAEWSRYTTAFFLSSTRRPSRNTTALAIRLFRDRYVLPVALMLHQDNSNVEPVRVCLHYYSHDAKLVPVASPQGRRVVSTPLLLEVAPEIDTNPTSVYRGRVEVGGSVRLQTPIIGSRSALAISVHPTYFDLATPLASAGTSYGTVCVCLSQVGVLLKLMDGSSWFWYGGFFGRVLHRVLRKYSGIQK